VTAGAATQLTLDDAALEHGAEWRPFGQQPVCSCAMAPESVSQAGVTVTAAIATGGGTLGEP